LRLEGYLSCTLQGVDCVGTLNQNTQDMPSIFTSNNLVSASKAPEASQVTMLKVVDQNNAFLLVRGYNLQNMPLTARVKQLERI